MQKVDPALVLHLDAVDYVLTQHCHWMKCGFGCDLIQHWICGWMQWIVAYDVSKVLQQNDYPKAMESFEFSGLPSVPHGIKRRSL